MIKSIDCKGVNEIRHDYIDNENKFLISVRTNNPNTTENYYYQQIDNKVNNILITYFSDLGYEDVGVYNEKFFFNEEIAKKIIDKIVELQNRSESIDLMIHCWAGVSRSAAIVKFIHDKFKIDLPQNFEIRTEPNKLVYDILEKAYNENVYYVHYTE